MKLLFVNHAMHCGGTDKVVHSLLETFAIEPDIECELLTVRKSEEDFFKVPESVKRYSLNFEKDDTKLSGIDYLMPSNLMLIWKIRQVVKASNPDFVISNWTSTNCLTLLSTIFLNKKVICYEHIHFDLPSFLWKTLRRTLYPFADKVLALTDEDKTKYEKFCNAVKVINPVSLLEGEVKQIEDKENVILGVGRLESQKGFDILIKSYSLIAKNFRNGI